jgi:hypothetical protein
MGASGSHNPSYLGGWDEGWKPAWAKMFVRPHHNQQVGTVAHAYLPKLHKRLRSGGSQFQASPGMRPYLNQYLATEARIYDPSCVGGSK